MYNAPLCVGAVRRFPGGEDMKKVKTPARKAAPAAKKAAAKPAGLLSKLKGAIARKPAAAKTAAKPATKAQPASKTASKAVASKKTVTASKKTPAAKPAPKSAAKPKAVAKPAAVAAKPAAAKPAPSAKPKAAPAPAPRKAEAPAPVAAKPAAKPAVRRAPPPDGVLTEDYIRSMSEDDYMNDLQLGFFRKRLVQMRNEVLQREVDVKERLHEREVFADPADRATAEEEHWLDLRLRERESLLLKKIDDALRRIESKEYGWCEKTGDPIGIPRLLARPTATVCVDIKGQDERVEAQFRDR